MSFVCLPSARGWGLPLQFLYGSKMTWLTRSLQQMAASSTSSKPPNWSLSPSNMKLFPPFTKIAACCTSKKIRFTVTHRTGSNSKCPDPNQFLHWISKFSSNFTITSRAHRVKNVKLGLIILTYLCIILYNFLGNTNVTSCGILQDSKGSIPFRLRRAQAWHIALLQRGGHQLHVAGVHEFHPQKGRQGQVEAIDGAPPGKMWGKCGAKNPGMWQIDLAQWLADSWDLAGFSELINCLSRLNWLGFGCAATAENRDISSSKFSKSPKPQVSPLESAGYGYQKPWWYGMLLVHIHIPCAQSIFTSIQMICPHVTTRHQGIHSRASPIGGSPPSRLSPSAAASPHLQWPQLAGPAGQSGASYGEVRWLNFLAYKIWKQWKYPLVI